MSHPLMPIPPDRRPRRYAQLACGLGLYGVTGAMLVRAGLGLDPWDEAGRLSSLGKREAVEQLARLIAEVPGLRRPLAEAREIADGLVEQLPKHVSDPPPRRPDAGQRYRWPSLPRRSQLLVFCVVAAAAALVSILLHGGGLPFGIGTL